jgi:site-specific DNA recombinase
MNNAFIYLRVSKEDQDEPGQGIDAQERDCRIAAGRLGITEDAHIRIYPDRDVKSITEIHKRPKLALLLAEIGAGDYLIYQHRDRLARDPDITKVITKMVHGKKALMYDARMGEVTEEPENILVNGILDLHAQYERNQTKRRCKAVSAMLKAKGDRYGTIPYGFTITEDKRLVPNEREGQIMRRIAQMSKAGIPVRTIATWLNENGYRTRGSKKRGTLESGGLWLKTQVLRIVQIMDEETFVGFIAHDEDAFE